MSAASGRRQTVVICCASLVADLYLKPICHYGPDKVFVFMNDGDDPVSKAEADIFESVRPRIECGKVYVRRGDTHDLKAVLCDIMDIKTSLYEEYGDDLDLFINVSSGTNEFSAAAFFASTARPRSVAFTVGADTNTTPDALKEIASGLDVEVSDPSRVIPVSTNDPDMNMVTFLSVMSELLGSTRFPRFEDVISCLKERGAWTYDPGRKSGTGKTTLKQKEKMYLKRNYIDKAVENGWLDKVMKDTYELTESGLMFISVYECRNETMRCVEEESICSNSMLLIPSRMEFSSAPDMWDECEPLEDDRIVISDGRRSYRFRVDSDRP